MPKKTIDEIEVSGLRVLMRVDFNVPLDAEGRITDDRRIEQSIPSIRSVIDRGGRLILMSHLGRPKGEPAPAFSLRPAADRLSALLPGVEVTFVSETIGPTASAAVRQVRDGGIVVLENLRFDPREKSGDRQFAASLAEFGDVYCNNAFGTAHRKHASMFAVPNAMSDRPRVAGLLLAAELAQLGGVVGDSAERPRVAVLGGAKVSDKMDVITNLLRRFEVIVIGGAMAYTLLAARGESIGRSLVETDKLGEAKAILDRAMAAQAELALPVDHVCGKSLTTGTATMTTEGPAIEGDWMGLDIGPKTIDRYRRILDTARTVVWNGPMGVFELPPFDVGTRAVAEAITRVTRRDGMTVVGGGDSAAAVELFDMAAGFSHVSTGGGASLQMLEGKAFATVDLLDEG